MSEQTQITSQTPQTQTQTTIPSNVTTQPIPAQQQPQQVSQQQVAQSQIGEDQREFMDIINDMIFAIQELSFALAEVDANEIAKVDGGKELLEAAKNVVKAGSRFHKFIKKRLRRPR